MAARSKASCSGVPMPKEIEGVAHLVFQACRNAGPGMKSICSGAPKGATAPPGGGGKTGMQAKLGKKMAPAERLSCSGVRAETKAVWAACNLLVPVPGQPSPMLPD